MKTVRIDKIMTNGKAMFLAYDQGLEHGPSSDFNDYNVDPLHIIQIAKAGKFNGVVFQKGIAEKYNKEIMNSGVPLILKLNGKTSLYKGEAISRQLCSVKEAIDLGASAVGFTIYIGSAYEGEMLKEFEQIEREAHSAGLPVIAWIYPRGKEINDDSSKAMMAYAARVGLEIGADIVKLKYNGKPEDLKWAVESAGRTKVIVAGGMKKGEQEFVRSVKGVMSSGAAGIAVGRNIWQAKDPIKLAAELRKLVFG